MWLHQELLKQMHVLVLPRVPGGRKKMRKNWQKKSKSGLGKLIMAAKLGIKFEIKFQKPCKNSKNGSDSGQKKMNGGKIGIKL